MLFWFPLKAGIFCHVDSALEIASDVLSERHQGFITTVSGWLFLGPDPRTAMLITILVVLMLSPSGCILNRFFGSEHETLESESNLLPVAPSTEEAGQ